MRNRLDSFFSTNAYLGEPLFQRSACVPETSPLYLHSNLVPSQPQLPRPHLGMHPHDFYHEFAKPPIRRIHPMPKSTNQSPSRNPPISPRRLPKPRRTRS